MMTGFRLALKRVIGKLSCPTGPQTFFPDLENFSYRIAVSPDGTKIVAWVKLRECERRLAVYRWTESLNDPHTPQNRVLLNDSVSAFLLSFEATIQFLKNQFPTTPGSPKFDQWLAERPQYDMQVRGLRTLRHFEAHVESKPGPRLVRMTVEVGKPVSLDSVSWKLPKLQSRDIASLRRSPLKSEELIDWNSLMDSAEACEVFGHGIRKLKDILLLAESML